MQRLQAAGQPTRAEVFVALLERPATVAELATRLRPHARDRRGLLAAVAGHVGALRREREIEPNQVLGAGRVRWCAPRPAIDWPIGRADGMAALDRLRVAAGC